MTKIIQFKKPEPKKKQTRRHAPRELFITRKLDK